MVLVKVLNKNLRFSNWKTGNVIEEKELSTICKRLSVYLEPERSMIIPLEMKSGNKSHSLSSKFPEVTEASVAADSEFWWQISFLFYLDINKFRLVRYLSVIVR